MNYTSIHKIIDLQEIIKKQIYISGNTSSTDEEIYHNMWCFDLGENATQKIIVADLEQFIDQVLQQRSQQLSKMNPPKQALFYLWFDQQALQLRFCLISAQHSSLPFGCKLNLINSPAPILQDFLTTTQTVATEGDTIEFLSSDDDQDDEENFVLDVFVKKLLPKDI